MKFLIISSSPQGATRKLSDRFAEEIKSRGEEVETLDLNKLHVAPCKACDICQDVDGLYCAQNDPQRGGGPADNVADSALIIAEKILDADIVLFSSPIFSWYCTAEMKALLDRLVYIMNQYYGKAAETSFWESKRCGLLVTSGYNESYGASVFEEGFRRYCKHSRLAYKGIYAVQAKHLDEARPEEFAEFLVNCEPGVYSNFITMNKKEADRRFSVDEVIDVAISGDVLEKYPLHNKDYIRKKAAEEKTREEARASADAGSCSHRVNLNKGSTYKLFLPIMPKFICDECGCEVGLTGTFRKGLWFYRIATAALMVLIFILAMPYLKDAVIVSVLLFVIVWLFLNYIGTFIFAKTSKYELIKPAR